MLSFSTGATEVCQNETALLRWVLMSLPQSWQYLGLPVSDTYKKKKKRLWALLFRFCCLTKLQFLAIQLTPILFHAHRNEISYRFAFIYTFSCASHHLPQSSTHKCLLECAREAKQRCTDWQNHILGLKWEFMCAWRAYLRLLTNSLRGERGALER